VRKAAAISILSILLINTAGFYVYYIVQLRQIRTEMRQALQLRPDDQLEVLRLTKKKYTEVRVDEHEVKVNGKMYDIARMKISDDSVIVYALHDEKEDNLLALMGEIISKPLKDRSSMPVEIVQFLTLLFVQPQSATDFFSVKAGILVSEYQFSIQVATPVMDSPPPKKA
jgi:hypothetical protein